uniref:Uncharacterized protein n=1 Tax=Tanacetum cinerariifolium TaxID=118510 RepID=A0A6L2MJP4_TANCI|nr:hypothetical protein [Tanacetum cinerariifolium]
MGEGSTNPTNPHHTPTIIQPFTYQPQKTKQHRKPRRNDTELPQTSVPKSVADEAVIEDIDDSLKKATTTATSLDAEQDRGDTVTQTRVLDLETTKTTQAMEIESLKRRVKKIKRRKRSRTHRLKRLYKVGLSSRVESFIDEGLGEKDASKQGRIADIDANKDITLVSTHDEQMFDADQDLGGEEVFIAQQDEKVVEKEVDAAQIQVTTAATTPTISSDEDTWLKHLLAAKRAQQEVEANIVLIKSWDDVQAKIDVDYQLAKRMQVEEQQELNDKEKAKLFMKLLEKRRKFFAAKIVEKRGMICV